MQQVNANQGWLEDFDPLVLEDLEELLDLEPEDFFGEAADCLVELGAGGRGATSAAVEIIGVNI